MSSIIFSLKDIKRRKLESFFYIIGVGVPLSVSIVITLIFPGVLFGLQSYLSNRVPLGLAQMFSAFFIFLWGISQITALVIVLTLNYGLMQLRQRDIIVMKASGASPYKIYWLFVSKIVILNVMSVIFAITISAITIFVISPHSISNFSNSTLIGVILLFLLLSYVFGYRAVLDIVEKMESKTGLYFFDKKQPAKNWKSPLSKISWKYRYAIRLIRHHRRLSNNVTLILFVIFFILIFSLFGSFLFLDTTHSYMQRSFGKDVYLITTPTMATQYIALCSFEEYNSTSNILNFDYFSELLPTNTVKFIEGSSIVSIYEERLITTTTIYERPSVAYRDGKYVLIGGYRQRVTVVVGINSTNTLSNWFIRGSYISGPQDVLLGDTLATYLVDDPFFESVEVFGKILHISGVAFSVENKGDVAFMDLSLMQQALNVNQVNLLFVKLNTQSTDEISVFDNYLKSQGLHLLDINQIIDKNMRILTNSWTLIDLLSSVLLISGLISITIFIFSVFTVNYRDFYSMLLVGATKKNIEEIAIVISSIYILKSVIPALVSGCLFAIFILFPEPALSYLSISLTLLIIFLSVGIVTIAHYLGAWLTMKKGYFDIISKT